MEPQATAKAPSDGRSYPFQVRGSLQTILALRLLAPNHPDFFTLLVDKIAHAPDFFRDAPIVIDLAAVADTPPIDLAGFAERLRAHRLVPVGVQNGSPAWNAEALKAGLAVFGSGGTLANRQGPARPNGDRQRPPSVPAAQPVPAAQRRGAAMVITEPVRGGQQVLAPEGDLVVLGPVGHGAELAAAGHVHVYGPLRGRAFAGIEGDESAMIFCDQLAAELLSIAGIYTVNEDIDQRLLNRRVRISCDGERLVLVPVP